MIFRIRALNLLCLTECLYKLDSYSFLHLFLNSLKIRHLFISYLAMKTKFSVFYKNEVNLIVVIVKIW